MKKLYSQRIYGLILRGIVLLSQIGLFQILVASIFYNIINIPPLNSFSAHSGNSGYYFADYLQYHRRFGILYYYYYTRQLKQLMKFSVFLI